MKTKQTELLKGLGIMAAGAYAIYYVLTQPCTATQQIGGQILELGGSMAKIICLSTQPKLMIASIIGSAALWTGSAKLFKNI